VNPPPRPALRRASPKRREGSCRFSKDVLALHVEGDLPDASAFVSSHLAACEECRRFVDGLHASQALVRSLRRETVSRAECAGMRREVMSIVTDRHEGWALGVERAIVLGFRRRSYALAAFAVLAIASVSVLAQMRHAVSGTTRAVAVFEAGDVLLRPENYRDWIVASAAATSANAGRSTASRAPSHTVYINPSAYREYVDTGKFPDGTLMVWESTSHGPEIPDGPHSRSPVLLASVKDSTRFDGGWGFFDFTGPGGTVVSRTQQLPDSSGCRACHLRDAETDHVFTQFYPVLRSASRLDGQALLRMGHVFDPSSRLAPPDAGQASAVTSDAQPLPPYMLGGLRRSLASHGAQVALPRGRLRA
jgi:hypothetical protein